MGILPERVAVEVNLKILKRSEYAEYKLHEGDAIEVVYFVGGGSGRPLTRTGTWRP
jgi:thiamine biosynthesis protein ThiS